MMRLATMMMMTMMIMTMRRWKSIQFLFRIHGGARMNVVIFFFGISRYGPVNIIISFVHYRISAAPSLLLLRRCRRRSALRSTLRSTFRPATNQRGIVEQHARVLVIVSSSCILIAIIAPLRRRQQLQILRLGHDSTIRTLLLLFHFVHRITTLVIAPPRVSIATAELHLPSTRILPLHDQSANRARPSIPSGVLAQPHQPHGPALHSLR
mmetsp:Transcript_3345/g.7486  ORF Transcript_3345/g.7486 Transcript_3345/m.7486 type:complete len:210 (+) Transcript_3345:1465-2094(+)